jgi:hypothetical protein
MAVSVGTLAWLNVGEAAGGPVGILGAEVGSELHAHINVSIAMKAMNSRKCFICILQ